MDTVSFDEFKKSVIKIGTIIEAEKVEGADKLLKLSIDFGNEKRTIVSGISEWYKPEEIIGKQIPVIINLEPRKIRGIESQGMILCADNTENGKPVLIHPTEKVPPGSPVL